MFASFPLPRRVLAVAFSALFALMIAARVTADDSKSEHGMHHAALPLEHQFGKGTPGENGGPYALTVKNTSDHALNLHGMIIWSVTSHDRAQSHKLGPKELGPGESWTINDLAVEDRVVLEAEGFAKWEMKTPPGEKH